MLKTLRLMAFVCQLITINLVFLFKLGSYKLVFLFKHYKILIFLYLVLFIQALLIIYQVKVSPPESPLMETAEYQKKIAGDLNLSKLKTYQLKAETKTLKQELNKYEENQASSYQHRDALINLALLNLALKNEDKYLEYLDQARQLDPNWPGFVKN